MPRSDTTGQDSVVEVPDGDTGDALDGVLGEEAGENAVPDDSGPAGDPSEGGPDTAGTPSADVPRVPCTTDSCDPASGECVFTPVPNWPPVPCDGQWHFCWDGECVGLPGGP